MTLPAIQDYKWLGQELLLPERESAAAIWGKLGQEQPEGHRAATRTQGNAFQSPLTIRTPRGLLKVFAKGFFFWIYVLESSGKAETNAPR